MFSMKTNPYNPHYCPCNKLLVCHGFLFCYLSLLVLCLQHSLTLCCRNMGGRLIVTMQLSIQRLLFTMLGGVIQSCLFNMLVILDYLSWVAVTPCFVIAPSNNSKILEQEIQSSCKFFSDQIFFQTLTSFGSKKIFGPRICFGFNVFFQTCMRKWCLRALLN